MATDRQVVEIRGRWSKTSSPVYVVKLVERESDPEFDKFFAPINPIERDRQYRESARKRG